MATGKYFYVESFKKIREMRQQENDQKCSSSNLEVCVNEKQKKRVFDTLKKNHSMTDEDITNCIKNNELVRDLMGMLCSINSSRQGTKDEAFVIQGIKDILEPRLSGFSIDNYKINHKVPIRSTGEILNRDLARKKYSKTELLKSIDFGGFVGGRTFIGTAKIRIGTGGHQDNVLQEEADFLRWLNFYAKPDHYYFILLDFEDCPDSHLQELRKQNLCNNVFICDHVEMQKKLEQLNEQ